MPRKKPASAQDRELKIRLPADVWQRVEAQAQDEGRPFNRIVINDLAAIPDLRQQRKLADHVGEMGNVLARYASEIVMHQLSGEMLNAIDALLKAEGGAVSAAIERVRVLRNAMQATKRK
jgi:hypothetical protein